MRGTDPPQLYTCRYWAFGSGCPNHDAEGVNLCLFAHWDTGRLASSFDQRGTCKFWLRGNCRKGDRCFYEHRNTGVDAMWQGRKSKSLLSSTVNDTFSNQLNWIEPRNCERCCQRWLQHCKSLKTFTASTNMLTVGSICPLRPDLVSQKGCSSTLQATS